MARPNDSLVVAPRAAGSIPVATHLVAAKEQEVIERATLAGHTFGTAHSYLLRSEQVVQGAGITHFDLFNGTTDLNLLLAGMWNIVRGDVTTATAALTTRFDLYRTSTAGTGGTAFTRENVGINSGGAVKDRRYPPLDPRIVARSRPTGGGTISAWLGWFYMRAQYNDDASMLSQFLRTGRSGRQRGAQPMLVLPPGQGVKLVQANAPGGGNVYSFLLQVSLR